MTWDWYLSYDNSFMVDLFVGQLKSSLECLVCGYVSNTFDPFWEIPLPLKKVSSCTCTSTCTCVFISDVLRLRVVHIVDYSCYAASTVSVLLLL